MESEQSLTPNSDGDRVQQRASANPFSYRSALHALLGMSDSEGKHVSYARMVPPVRYTPQSFLEALQETDLSDFDDEAAYHPGSSAGSSGAAAPHHAPFEGKGSSLLSVPQPSPTGTPASYANPVVANRSSHLEASTRHTPRQRDIDVTSEHDRGLGAATAKVDQPNEVPQEITIAVPGTSARPRHFPALAPEKQDDRPVSTTEEGKGVARASGHHRGLRSTLSPERGEQLAGERKPTSESHLIAESEDGALGRLRGNVRSSVNGDVTASIEQLRRTVRELAAKVASRQARTQDETPLQQTVKTPPQAVPRVVVIKQAAPRSGPPRAFWERSYLSHLSWRTLR
jgi:hypothetical protein